MQQPFRFIISMVMVALLAAWCASISMAATADLLEALEQGTVWAEFRGTGDLGVDATIGRQRGSPDYVTIAPGTQFWAQAGGRQGQTTLGWVPIDLSGQAVVRLRIPTACTNINRPAPTPDDILFPEPCPDERMAVLCGLIQLNQYDLNVVQLAVWAVANNPTSRSIRRQLNEMVSEEVTSVENRREQGARLLDAAAALLERANLDPADFRMFR